MSGKIQGHLDSAAPESQQKQPKDSLDSTVPAAGSIDEARVVDPFAEIPLTQAGHLNFASDYIPALSEVYSHLVSMAPLNVPNERLTRFHAVKAPSISISAYVNRLNKYMGCSRECYVLSLIYIDRLLRNRPTFLVSSLNIHRLLITAVLVAAKYFDDVYYSNAYYAKVGGIRTDELNQLEALFLSWIGWQLKVTNEEFVRYRKNVMVAASATAISSPSSPAKRGSAPAATGKDFDTPASMVSASSAASGPVSSVAGDSAAAEAAEADVEMA